MDIRQSKFLDPVLTSVEEYKKHKDFTNAFLYSYLENKKHNSADKLTSSDTKNEFESAFSFDHCKLDMGDRSKCLEWFCNHSYISSDFFNFLIGSNFLMAPGSINHHGNYEGGLFDHSYAVARQLVRYTEALDLGWGLERSPIIVGLFHDLCKVDNYVYNRQKGIWEYNNNRILNGHGEKSVIMLSRFMTLTEEEIACIRWHMGAYDEKENWEFYNRAVQKFPNVLYIHTADMYAANILGV